LPLFQIEFVQCAVDSAGYGSAVLDGVINVHGVSRDNLGENGWGNQSLKRRPVARS
jgi:hypothetical protein